MKIEDMVAKAADVREGETFLAYLFPPMRGRGWRIGIIRPNGRTDFEGFAEFPPSWEHEARAWLSDLYDDTDVENLLRQWSQEHVRDDFEIFVAEDRA